MLSRTPALPASSGFLQDLAVTVDNTQTVVLGVLRLIGGDEVQNTRSKRADRRPLVTSREAWAVLQRMQSCLAGESAEQLLHRRNVLGHIGIQDLV